MTERAQYDPDCTRCPRLAGFLGEVRARYPDYWARPVPSFGAADPRVLAIGLAPELHGAHRRGRPFTGDYAGILLYRTLYDAGLATIIEVADSQRLLLQAEVGDAVARLGVWRALLAEAAAKGNISELLK